VLSSSRVRVRIRVRFSVWLVSCYAHAFVLLSIVIDTPPILRGAAVTVHGAGIAHSKHKHWRRRKKSIGRRHRHSTTDEYRENERCPTTTEDELERSRRLTASKFAADQ